MLLLSTYTNCSILSKPLASIQTTLSSTFNCIETLKPEKARQEEILGWQNVPNTKGTRLGWTDYQDPLGKNWSCHVCHSDVVPRWSYYHHHHLQCHFHLHFTSITEWLKRAECTVLLSSLSSLTPPLTCDTNPLVLAYKLRNWLNRAERTN